LRTLLLFLFWSPFFWAQETFVVYFDTDKFELTPTESERLQQFLQTENITIQKIIGFCDYRASDAYNQILSEKRAQFVYSLVKGKFTNAISLEGKGEKFPQNLDLQQNRKVEIYYVAAIPEILEKMEKWKSKKKSQHSIKI
jgi:outer membrane protein OmpA-like peptidoglycan-associated protein